jgi:heterodisulfide reductase subunit B2
MKIGYYPGCSLKGSSREFDESVRAVAEKLEIELPEVPDWNCCGGSSAHALSHELAVALPANVLARAAKAELTELVAPCAACYNRLVSAQYDIAHSPKLKAEVEQIIDAPLDRPVRVLNILELLDRVADKIKAKVTRPFDWTVACYYGCLLVRPARVVAFDRPEDPQSMDKLVAAVGGKTIDWNFKTECCGGGFSITRTPIVAKLGGRILTDAVERKAQAIVVACPMCHSNLDLRRGNINEHLGQKHDIPVLFITQVVGLALGLPASELGLRRHFVPVNLPQKAAAAASS